MGNSEVVETQIYKVRDPGGVIRKIRGPIGASDEEVLTQAKSLFQSTISGAALGNPALERYGDLRLRQGAKADPFVAIGSAALTGGALGAASPEILTGLGRAAMTTPYTARLSPFLTGAGQVLKSGGRAAPTAAGAISGATGETAGQIAEAAGAGPVTAEAARLVGGGLTAETANLAKTVLHKYILTPALSLRSKIKKETVIALLEKIEGAPQSITAKELKFIEEQIAELRGPSGKTDAPLEAVGSIMGVEGQRVMSEADQKMIAALSQASGAQIQRSPVERADIGAGLRDTINKRNEAMLIARSSQYAKTEKVRDALVASKENAGTYINALPQYQSILDDLKAQLDNSVVMKRSPDVQRSLQKVLDELSPPKPRIGVEPFPGLNIEQATPETKQIGVSFQAIDDVRRKLGEVFKGKPAEGYEALNDARGRELYAKLTALQKKFAGGDAGPHAKLLEDYHAQSEALEQFRTRLGRKTTTLDQYQEGQFSTDASTLPSTYFKTRASIQALKELTGNDAQVNAAALQFVNNELAGKDAAAVRRWLAKNTEWVAEVPAVRRLADNYATRLEGAERSLRNAENFAKQAAKDSAMLTHNALPAQRAVDLIKSGDTELWGRIAPVIAQSPQAKAQMVNAVRQVVADQATAKATSDLFSRNIRPFLESTKIATKEEMDFIAQKLSNIQAMSIPEPEKLGIARRIILNSAGAWTATALSRTGTTTYQWMKEKQVPE